LSPFHAAFTDLCEFLGYLVLFPSWEITSFTVTSRTENRIRSRDITSLCFGAANKIVNTTIGSRAYLRGLSPYHVVHCVVPPTEANLLNFMNETSVRRRG